MVERNDNRCIRGAYSAVRGLVLAVSTLAIVGVLFAVYQYSTGVSAPPSVERLSVSREEPSRSLPAAEEVGSAPAVRVDESPLGEGGEFRLVQYEPGTKQARIELESTGWRPVGDADGDEQTIEVDRPDIRLKTPNGQRVRVRADAGLIVVAQRGEKSFDPRRGELTGNVRMEVDRLSEVERERLPPDQREAAPDDARMIRLTFDDLSFDQEGSRLETDGPFGLRMAEAEVQGAGLRVTYDDVDGRVEHFEIMRGGSVRAQGVPRWWGSILPGGGDARRVTRKGEMAGSTSQPQADTDTAEKTANGAPTDTYVANIAGEVVIKRFQGEENVQRLAADHVRVLFDFGREQREALRAGRSKLSEDGEAASVESSAGGTGGSAAERVLLSWSGRLVLGPEFGTTDEAAASDGDGRRLRMVASGDEVRWAERQGEVVCRRLEVHQDTRDLWITGDEAARVVLTLAEVGTLVCGDVRVDGGERLIRVDGPARLTGSNEPASEGSASDGPGPVAGGMDVRFEQSAELHIGAHTERSVNPVTGEEQEKTLEYIESGTFRGDVVIQRGPDTIAGDVVTVTFDPPRGPDAVSRSLRSLEAAGSVLLVRGSDRLTCGDLHLTFVTGPLRGVVPRTAKASDNVMLTRGEMMVTAQDSVLLEMTPVAARLARDVVPPDAPVNPQGSIPPPRHPERPEAADDTVGIEWLAAQGDVTVFDPSRDLDLRAESLVAQMRGGRDIDVVRITAPEEKPAFIQLDEFLITARHIDAELSDQRADVYGPGKVHWMARRGLDGERLPHPQPVDVAWSEGMSFRGAANTARFVGNVHAVSRRSSPGAAGTAFGGSGRADALPQVETATFDAQELVIDFVDIPPQSQEGGAGEPPSPGKTTSPALHGAEQVTPTGRKGPRLNKEPVYLVASRDVVGVFSGLETVTGRVTTRARFTSDKLTVDLRDALLNVPGPGSLLVEDYRPVPPSPEPAETPGSLLQPSGGKLPSQTYISWSGSLSYHQARHRADFRDEVHLDHRSGRDMVLAKDQLGDYQFSPQRDTGAGRQTVLDCGRLVVEFAGSDDPAADPSVAVGTMNVSDIRQLEATGGVLLADDFFTVDAYRVVKYDNSELLRVYGTSSRDAEIYGRGPGEPQFRAPEFNYDLATGRIDALSPRVRGRGETGGGGE